MDEGQTKSAKDEEAATCWIKFKPQSKADIISANSNTRSVSLKMSDIYSSDYIISPQNQLCF